MSEKLSKKQLEVLNCLKNYIREKGYPPTVREIGEAVNLKSTSSVHAHIETLEKLGYIKKDPSKTRAMLINDESFYHTSVPSEASIDTSVIQVPVVGDVAAGMPMLAEENIVNYIALNEEFLPQGKEIFSLRIKGESMINIGFYPGDYLLVQKQSTASNGDVVVALIGEEATVKTFYKENGHFRLQPENDFMDPIIVKHVEIIGKAVGLFRYFT